MKIVKEYTDKNTPKNAAFIAVSTVFDGFMGGLYGPFLKVNRNLIVTLDNQESFVDLAYRDVENYVELDAVLTLKRRPV